MKINTFQSIATIIAICFLLFGMIGGSQAAEITSMSTYATNDYGNGSQVYADLTADEDISYIYWYAKQTFPKTDADDDYEYIYTSMHGNGTRSVSVLFSQLFDGHIKMATSEIKAVADFWNGQQWNQDTAITTVDVCQPDLEIGYKGIEKNLYGFSELTAHYFNGSAITMEGYCSVSNGSNQDASITGRFRHTNNADPWNPKEKEFANILKPRGFTFYSSSDWGSAFFDFPTTLKDREVWNCKAYIRIEATYGRFPKVDWLGEASNRFDHNDHR